jgi:hypothetical protein
VGTKPASKKGIMKRTIILKAISIATALVSFLCLNSRAEYVPHVKMDKISEIESNTNDSAVNRREGAYGRYQIRQCVVTEYNRAHGTAWKVSDMTNHEISSSVADWYMHHRIPEMLLSNGFRPTESLLIWSWNAGIKSVIDNRMPPVTMRYLAKYYSLKG